MRLSSVAICSRRSESRKHAVADEIDCRNARRRALVDLEHQVDAVLRPLNDLGFDRRGEAPGSAVQFDDPLHVGLDTGAREHHARPDLHFLVQVGVGELEFPSYTT